MTRDDLLRLLCGLLDAQFEELLFRLSVRREYLPPPTAPRMMRAIELIQYLESQDRLSELDRAIAVVEESISILHEGEFGEWDSYLETLQRQVCSIDIRGACTGTAFLVEHDIVLTAFTAVRQLLDGEVSPGEANFRFDLLPSRSGHVSTGVAYRLAEVDWIVDRSPPERLNFAALRLSDSPRGGKQLGDVALRSSGRGYIALPDVTRPLTRGATLFLVHHPGEGSIRLSMDLYAVKRMSRDGCRFVHAIATDNGSIGGPFFDTTGALVAIHEGTGGMGKRTSVVWNAILSHCHPQRWK